MKFVVSVNCCATVAQLREKLGVHLSMRVVVFARMRCFYSAETLAITQELVWFTFLCSNGGIRRWQHRTRRLRLQTVMAACRRRMQLRNAMTELRIPRHSDAKNPSNIQIGKVMSLSKKLQKGRTGTCETQEGDVAPADETSSADSHLRLLSLRKWNDSLKRMLRVAGKKYTDTEK